MTPVPRRVHQPLGGLGSRAPSERAHGVDSIKKVEVVCRERVEIAVRFGACWCGGRIVDEGIKAAPNRLRPRLFGGVGVVGDVTDGVTGAGAATGIGGRLRFDAARGMSIDDHPCTRPRRTRGGRGAQSRGPRR